MPHNSDPVGSLREHIDLDQLNDRVAAIVFMSTKREILVLSPTRNTHDFFFTLIQINDPGL